MTVLHFVTLMVYPQPGGLEESLLRIARGLAHDGFRSVIYTLRQPEEHAGPHPAHEGVDVVHLSGDKQALREPYRHEEEVPPRVAKAHGREVSRLEYIVLESAIARRVEQSGGARHLIVSFYASTMGFVAQQVASRLAIPHISSVRGPEYCVDYRSGQYHFMVRFVVENADLVVTTNQEQADVLGRVFKPHRRLRTIHNASVAAPDRPYWTPPDTDRIELICDTEFSGRKGTHLLLDAVVSLLDADLPLRLTVLGGVFWQDSESYWREKQQDCLQRHPNGFRFPGRVPADAVEDYLRGSHIYCSATLGEGCSLSRVRALTLGIPIVTTRCGALPEVAAGCDHVRFCPAGDWRAFAAELESIVRDLRDGLVRPDRERIARWRSHFSRERELADWRSAVHEGLQG
jgi:glycosyltransferase involved in cell wall biosynthesis